MCWPVQHCSALLLLLALPKPLLAKKKKTHLAAVDRCHFAPSLCHIDEFDRHTDMFVQVLILFKKKKERKKNLAFDWMQRSILGHCLLLIWMAWLSTFFSDLQPNVSFVQLKPDARSDPGLFQYPWSMVWWAKQGCLVVHHWGNRSCCLPRFFILFVFRVTCTNPGVHWKWCSAAALPVVAPCVTP